MSSPIVRLLQFDVAVLAVTAAGSAAFAAHCIANDRPSLAGLAVAMALFVGTEFLRELRRTPTRD